MHSNTIMSPVMSPLRATFHFRPIQNGRSGWSVQKIAPIIVQVSGLPVGTLIFWPLEMFEKWLMSCLHQTDTANFTIAFACLFARWRSSRHCWWRGVTYVNRGHSGVHKSSVNARNSWWCLLSMFRAWGVHSLIETFVPHIRKWVSLFFLDIPQWNDGHARWIYQHAKKCDWAAPNHKKLWKCWTSWLLWLHGRCSCALVSVSGGWSEQS